VVSGPSGATTSESAFVTVGIDSDQDGMPDDWELAYGLNPFDPSDAAQDADGDGFSNYDEFVAGTNPRAGDDYLALTAPEAGGIRFFAAAGRSYSILACDSLVVPYWRKLKDLPPSAKGGEVSFSEPPQAPQRYYRLITPAQ
jgi:hypothetical protein